MKRPAWAEYCPRWRSPACRFPMWPVVRAFRKTSRRRAHTSSWHARYSSRAAAIPRWVKNSWSAASVGWRMGSAESGFTPEQTEGLRSALRPDPVQVIAVTGGKGGVGKTCVAINLASALSAQGKRVLLLDGDLGLANADVQLGIAPRYTLEHVLDGRCTLEEAI